MLHRRISVDIMVHGRVERKLGGTKFSKDMALLFAFYKSLPRHRAIKLKNRPINTLSLLVILHQTLEVTFF